MSTRPGWFPDPTGGPGLLRYWDGHRWTEQTTPAPQAGPPSGAPVHDWGGAIGSAARHEVRIWVIALVITVGILAVIALVVMGAALLS